jgi:hypothetical protein
MEHKKRDLKQKVSPKTNYEYMQVCVYASGYRFNTTLLKGNYKPFKLEILNSLGEIIKRGRYRGQTDLNGSCVFISPKTMTHALKIHIARDIVFQLRKESLLLINKIEVHLNFRGTQGNMELTSRELKDLASLEIPICMHYTEEKY